MKSRVHHYILLIVIIIFKFHNFLEMYGFENKGWYHNQYVHYTYTVVSNCSITEKYPTI